MSGIPERRNTSLILDLDMKRQGSVTNEGNATPTRVIESERKNIPEFTHPSTTVDDQEGPDITPEQMENEVLIRKNYELREEIIRLK